MDNQGMAACRSRSVAGAPNLAAMTTANSNVSNEPLSPGEVCRLLHISRSTLPTWRASGELVGTQTPGGHWRYSPDSPAVVRMLAQLSKPARDVIPIGQLSLDADQ